jgi:hypothetical protein
MKLKSESLMYHPFKWRTCAPIARWTSPQSKRRVLRVFAFGLTLRESCTVSMAFDQKDSESICRSYRPYAADARLSLGMLQCRYSYYPDTMVERVVREYRERGLPTTLYEDDGSTPAYERGVFRRTTVNVKRGRIGYLATIDVSNSEYNPGACKFSLVIKSLPATKVVIVADHVGSPTGRGQINYDVDQDHIRTRR